MATVVIHPTLANLLGPLVFILPRSFKLFKLSGLLTLGVVSVAHCAHCVGYIGFALTNANRRNYYFLQQQQFSTTFTTDIDYTLLVFNQCSSATKLSKIELCSSTKLTNRARCKRVNTCNCYVSVLN